MKNIIPTLDFAPVVLEHLDRNELRTGNWIYIRQGSAVGLGKEGLYRYEPVQLTEGWEEVTQFFYPIQLTVEMVKAVAGRSVFPNAIGERSEVFEFDCGLYDQIVMKINGEVRIYGTGGHYLDIPNLHTLQNIYQDLTGRELQIRSNDQKKRTTFGQLDC